MRKYMGIILAVTLVFGIMGFSSLPVVGPGNANACACSYRAGDPGGGDFAPQRRGAPGAPGAYFNRPALTKEQAKDLVTRYVKRWNPELEIGEIKDAGSFYEAEVLSGNKEVVGRLAVDKGSGRLMIIK